MKKKSLIILISILGLLLGGSLGYYYLFNNNVSTSNVTTDIKEATFDNSDEYSISLSDSVNITKDGVYYFDGTLDGVISVNTSGDVKLVLSDVTINSDSAAIYIENANVVYIEVNGTNTINANVNEEINAAIYSNCDIVFTGSGSLDITSNYSGIKSKDNISIESSTITINASEDGIHSNDSLEISGGNISIKAGDDGIHANEVLEINDGTISISAAEGLEATYVKINGGTLTISASDDGINAAQKSDKYTPTVEINGGVITITMGQGDTDGIDSNGNLYINGGTLTITGQSPFDYDLEAKYSGGKMIINGEETTTITNQFANGMGGTMQGEMRQNNNDMTPPDQDNRQQNRRR